MLFRVFVYVCMLYLYLYLFPLRGQIASKRETKQAGLRCSLPSGILLEDWQMGSGDDHTVSSAVRVTR